MIAGININNYYWVIGGSMTDIYQSRTNTLVPVSDQEYVDWGGAPIPIASVDELAVALKSNGSQLPAWLLETEPTFIQPTPTTYSKPQLAAYAADARWRKQTGGITVTSVAYRTDRVSSNERNNAYNYALVNASAIFKWKLPDGTFVSLDKAALTNVTISESTFVQNCFTKENDTVTSINGGTITTLAQIDSAFAAVSNVFP